MTRIGDDILHNCPKCYRENGYSVKLTKNSGGELICEYDSSHRFRIENGMLKETNNRK